MMKSDAIQTPNEHVVHEDGVDVTPVKTQSRPQSLSEAVSNQPNIRSKARVLAILVALYVT